MEIGGTVITQVSLCGAAELDRLIVEGLEIGGTVYVVKAGDVIPKITAAVRGAGPKKAIVAGSCCPACAQPAIKKYTASGESSADLFCSNRECPGIKFRRLMHYARTLKIKGLGDELMLAMRAAQIIDDSPTSLYTLRPNTEQFDRLTELKVGGRCYGTSAATKLCAEIAKTYELELPVFLSALGIPNLGEQRVRQLAVASKKIDQDLNILASWCIPGVLPRFAQTLGIPNVALQIEEGLAMARETIRELLGVIKVRPIGTNAPTASVGPLVGEVVCLTGAFPKTKTAIHEDIRAAGGCVSESVNAKVTLVVAEDPAGISQKLTKAAELGLRIQSWDVFSLRIYPASTNEVEIAGKQDASTSDVE